jgi:membrane glycosyltransferase
MRHGSQLLLGLVWAVGMAWLDLRFLFWLAPIVVSLILSPFVSVISSRRPWACAPSAGSCS